MDQYVGPAVTDHRGLVEMPAYAVMAESVTSGAYWYSFPEPVATVQSWLALTAAVPAQVGDRLTGKSRLTHRDESYGTSTVAVHNPGGDVVCSGAVRVGRTTAELRAIDKDELSASATELSLPPQPQTPALPIDPGLDGTAVLSGMRRGAISMGPLAELLGDDAGDGGVRPGARRRSAALDD